MPTAITPPFVHTNGSGLKTLTDGYAAADDSLRDFTEAWGRVEFNPRDYYPGGPEYWEAARTHRDKINAMIREIGDYITEHRVHLDECS